MRYFKPFVDQRLGNYCVYCHGRPTTRDHIPPRVFLDDPFPENLPVVPACRECNEATSLDEEYVACLIEIAACGSLARSALRRPKVVKILDEKPALAARIAQSSAVTADGVAIEPDRQRVERVFEKVARGLTAFETGVPPADHQATVRYAPLSGLTQEELQRFRAIDTPQLLPEVGSRMMQRALVVGEERIVNDWEDLQPGQFSYAVDYLGAVTRVKFEVGGYLAVEVDLSPRA